GFVRSRADLRGMKRDGGRAGPLWHQSAIARAQLHPPDGRAGGRPRHSVEGMITAEGLGKRYGDKVAVDDVSFTVRPGSVTGFLGPNGAGKSTTMRMIAGLDRPSTGRVTVNGKEYRRLRAPLSEVGVLLDAKAV